jgi:SPW repeat
MVNRGDEYLPAQWQDSANLALGLWLAISPWILPYDGQEAVWNARLIGLAIAGVAASALVAYDLGKEWL